MNTEINADRFIGFSQVYDENRPSLPNKAIELMIKYLEKAPENVIDIGCGTGLSTTAWKNYCKKAIGIEPSDDMYGIAKEKQCENIEFIKAFSDNVPLCDDFADIVLCSQSFHWMSAPETLDEANRLLKKGGIFATVDCDWPPLYNVAVESAYDRLFDIVREIEITNADISKTFVRTEKENHLKNIKASNHFSYTREIVFMNREKCDRKRYIGIAISQGSLQAVLKNCPEKVQAQLDDFINTVNSSWNDNQNYVDFCYRMRIGKK